MVNASSRLTGKLVSVVWRLECPGHIDYNDPRYAESAADILRRHDSAEPEANITSAVRDFLVTTGLVRPSEIVEENPPGPRFTPGR